MKLTEADLKPFVGKMQFVQRESIPRDVEPNENVKKVSAFQFFKTSDDKYVGMGWYSKEGDKRLLNKVLFPNVEELILFIYVIAKQHPQIKELAQKANPQYDFI